MTSSDAEARKKKSKTMKYIVTRTIGKGAFGVVYLAREEKSEKTYAIKETYQDPNYKNREAQIVKELLHPNIVKVHHIFFSQKTRGTYLHLVMDHLPSNLFEYIQKIKHTNRVISEKAITFIMYQVCRGIGYIHKKGICHRDIKPQNILLDPATMRTVVCDFGSAKVLVDREWNKTYICSRFYRAPELLFQSNYYTTAVDMWSVGCVFAELYHLSPLFAAADTDGQISIISDILGPVGRDHIKVFRLESCKVLPRKTTNWQRILGRDDRQIVVSQDAADVLYQLITYDCVSRVQGFDALKLKFFNGVREFLGSSESQEFKNAGFKPCKEFFAFTKSEREQAKTDGWAENMVL